jgi:hypothetical protein
MAQLEAALGSATDKDDDGVWPDNVDIVDAFVAAQTQWRIVPLASGRLHYIGLDYTAARTGIEGAGIAVTRDLWSGLLIMEDAALIALNEADG